MKIISYLTRNSIIWILAFLIFITIIYNEEISDLYKNPVLSYAVKLIPVFLMILSLAYILNLNGIEENLWDDFKKGRDFHIDKMMKNLKFIFVLIVFFSLIWLFLILYSLNYENYLKSLLIISIPVIITVTFSKHYYKLQKEYNASWKRLIYFRSCIEVINRKNFEHLTQKYTSQFFLHLF